MSPLGGFRSSGEDFLKLDIVSPMRASLAGHLTVRPTGPFFRTSSTGRRPVLVVAAGVTASYATQTRRDLGVANRGIFEHLAEQCIPRLAQALFIVVSDPVELAVKIFSLAFHSAPQLLRRDDDLQQLCPDGVALATVCSARVGLGTICREHGSQGSQHVAVPRMETVQETLVVAVATGGLGNSFLKYSE